MYFTVSQFFNICLQLRLKKKVFNKTNNHRNIQIQTNQHSLKLSKMYLKCWTFGELPVFSSTYCGAVWEKENYIISQIGVNIVRVGDNQNESSLVHPVGDHNDKWAKDEPPDSQPKKRSVVSFTLSRT